MTAAPVSRYGFINAKLRAKISTIMPEEFRENLLRAASLEDVFLYLKNTEFASLSEIYHRTGDLQAVEAELFSRRINQYREVVRRTDGHVRDFTAALTIRLEIENLKTLLRLWYGSRIKKRPMDHRVAYIYREKILHAISWDSLINAAALEDITAALGDSPYRAVLLPFLETPVESEGIFHLETALDRFYYLFLAEQAAGLPSSDRKIVSRIMTAEIDLQNLSWLIRYSRFYRVSTDDLSDVLMPGGFSFGPEQMAPLFAAESGRSPKEEEGASVSLAAGLLANRYPALRTLTKWESGGSSPARAALFEQLLEQIRKREFEKIITGYPFTIGIILAYFFLRNRESRFLTGIFNGKFYGWDSNRMREFSR